MLFVRRGYLLLMAGLLLGFSAFSFISLLYSNVGVPVYSDGMPSEIEIDFLYSSEKQGWIEEVIPMFEVWFERTFNISVSVWLTPAGSVSSIRDILNGNEKPTVWSPASSIWIPYMNTQWRDVTGLNYDIAVDYWPLILSPVVLAGWGSVIEEYNITGFMDLYYLAKEGVDFKYGHPDPLLSNGGTMTVVLEFAEAVGKRPEDLTVEDLMNETVIEIVSTIESKAVMYGDSTGFFGSWAAGSGPGTIDFFGIYENVVLDNSLLALNKWNDPLVAVYPKSGTLMSDHPFVILNATWINDLQRLAAGQFLLFLHKPEIQELAQKHGFRPAISNVPLDQTSFNPINGLQYEISIPIHKSLKGEVLEAILTLWVKVRNG